MDSSNSSATPVLTILTIILGGIMVVFGLLFGIANLIQPNVPDAFLAQNTRVCVGLILISLVIIYSIFRPYFGGILLIICALTYFIIVGNPLVYPIILIAILTLFRGLAEKRNKQKKLVRS